MPSVDVNSKFRVSENEPVVLIEPWMLVSSDFSTRTSHMAMHSVALVPVSSSRNVSKKPLFSTIRRILMAIEVEVERHDFGGS